MTWIQLNTGVQSKSNHILWCYHCISFVLAIIFAINAIDVWLIVVVFD